MQCTRLIFSSCPMTNFREERRFTSMPDCCRCGQQVQSGRGDHFEESDEVARGFAKIYRHGPLKWPQMLQVDPGREFMGAVTKAMSEHNVTIRRGRTNIHRDQAIVERFNRTLAEKLFGFQYAVEMNLPSGRSTAWVKRLPEVVSSLNNEVTRLIGKKPAVAIREKAVSAKPATTYMRPVG